MGDARCQIGYSGKFPIDLIDLIDLNIFFEFRSIRIWVFLRN